MLRYKAIIFFFCVLPLFASAQYYNIGQDPASLRWRQIVTPATRLIYPEDFEKNAQYLAQVLDYVHHAGSYSLNWKPARIPVIVHSRNIEPNAFTIWAPKRIELFTCPPQISYAQPWLDQLAIHEYRHAVQMDRSNQGATKVLSWIFGQQVVAAINGLYVPTWFMEGDAVCAETALSKTGRGRVPDFEMDIRAQVLQKGKYSYDKAALGSYRSFVPDQYALGYPMVANVRKQYGARAWIMALDEVAKNPFSLNAFNRGLKKSTGHTKEQLYKITYDSLKLAWQRQDELTEKTAFTKLTSVENSTYTKFKYPQYVNDSLVVAEQSGIDDIARFVLIGTDGYREVLATPGFFSSEVFSVYTGVGFAKSNKPGSMAVDNLSLNSGLLTWTEKIADKRWENRNYSVIKILDLKTRSLRTLTRKSRYFSPALSPDGSQLVAVSIDESNICRMVTIDTGNGVETGTLLQAADSVFITPVWSTDGRKIVYMMLDHNGKSIHLLDRGTGKNSVLLPSTYDEISAPVFASNYILFNASYSGIGNIFAIDTTSKEVFQVTSSAFGAFNARLNPAATKIVYSDYSSNGFDLVEAPFHPEKWRPFTQVQDHSVKLYESLLKDEEQDSGLMVMQKMTYESTPYRKVAHLFNFHSWAPAYINYMSGETGAGVSFMSQNELNTSTLVAGYNYDFNERTGKTAVSFEYAGWYPVIDVEASQGRRAAYTDSDQPVRYTFDESIVKAGFNVPLLFTGGKYYKRIQIGASTAIYNITRNTSDENNKLTGTINTVNYSFAFSRFIKQSLRDVYPRWGQILSVQYKHSPFGDNNLGDIFAVQSRLFFPGFAKHHGLRVDAAWQKRTKGDYSFSSLIAMPRGYVYEGQNKLQCLMLSYKFPFLYPDWAMGRLAYFKRFKANIFYDNAIADSDADQAHLVSTGIELTTDMHLFRFLFPLDLGARIGYVPAEKRTFLDFLFSVNLSI